MFNWQIWLCCWLIVLGCGYNWRSFTTTGTPCAGGPLSSKFIVQIEVVSWRVLSAYVKPSTVTLKQYRKLQGTVTHVTPIPEDLEAHVWRPIFWAVTLKGNYFGAHSDQVLNSTNSYQFHDSFWSQVIWRLPSSDRPWSQVVEQKNTSEAFRSLNFGSFHNVEHNGNYRNQWDPWYLSLL